MPRQSLVDEHVVGIQEVEHAPIFSQHGVEEGRGLLLHRFKQRGIHLGKRVAIDLQVSQPIEVQPLSCELLAEPLTAGIGKQPFRFHRQGTGSQQPACVRLLPQLIIRQTAPEKEGEPRGLLDSGQW